MKFQSLLDEFVRDARQCFGEALTGVYLHGSLALNGFNPEKSDIDLILITETAPSDAQKRAFMDRAVLLNERAPAKGLEFSVVERRYANPFAYPTPFELHFSPMHLRRYREDPDGYIRGMKGTDADLAAERLKILSECHGESLLCCPDCIISGGGNLPFPPVKCATGRCARVLRLQMCLKSYTFCKRVKFL